MQTGTTRSYKARKEYACAACGGSIDIGQYYRWNRQPAPNNLYWHDDCDNPDAIPSYVIQDGKAQYRMEESVSATPSSEYCPDCGPVPQPPVIEDEPVKRLEDMTIDEVKLLLALKRQALSSGVSNPAAQATKQVIARREKNELAKRIAVNMASTPCAPISYQALPDNAPWPDILAQVSRILKRILVIGPPGTGKSETIRRLLGIKHRVTMTPNMQAEMLLGSFILKDGETKFQDGPVPLAMQDGTILQMDEWDRQSPECESQNYAIMDDAPHVNLIDGRTVSGAPGFGVIGTSNNPQPQLEDAILDRVDAIILAYEPHEAILKSLTVPGAQAACKNYYATQPKPNIKRPATARRWRAFNQLIDGKLNPNIAARVVFGNSAAPEVMSVLANLIKQTTKKEGTK